MELNRTLRQEQLGGDFRIGIALDHKPEYTALLGGKAETCLVGGEQYLRVLSLG